jgi:hypothetical protein
MRDRMADIEGSVLGPANVDARLQAYPELRAKIETLLRVIENAGGEAETAAVAEQQVIDALRSLGNNVLHQWASRQHEKKEAEYTATPGVNRKEKKRSTGTRGSAPSP